jgi:hypothetical protein
MSQKSFPNAIVLPSHSHESRIEILRESLRRGTRTRSGRFLRELAHRAALDHARRLMADSKRSRSAGSAELRRQAQRALAHALLAKHLDLLVTQEPAKPHSQTHVSDASKGQL